MLTTLPNELQLVCAAEGLVQRPISALALLTAVARALALGAHLQLGVASLCICCRAKPAPAHPFWQQSGSRGTVKAVRGARFRYINPDLG